MNVSKVDEIVKPKAPKILRPAEIQQRLLRGDDIDLEEWDPRGLSIQEVEHIEDRPFNLDEYLEKFFPSWLCGSGDKKNFGLDALLAFNPNERQWNDSILGDRLLCERGSLVLNGASGIGKSSLMMQAAICWVLGRGFFGIKPARPLNILFIQSENDFGDIATAIQGTISRMDLSADDLEVLKTNLAIRQETALTGRAFIKYVVDQIDSAVDGGMEGCADLVIADPLLSYIGGDVTRQDVVSKFLRNELQLLLNRSGIAWIWTHHTNKPRDGRGGRTGDERMYFGNGSSEITNWARVIMTLERKSGDRFWLSIDKREKHSPWTDKDGKRVNGIAIQHSKDGVVWERADGNSSVAVNFDSALAADREVSAVKDFITEKGTVSLDSLKAAGPTLNDSGIGVNRVSAIAKSLAEEDGAGIYTYRARTKGSTNKAIVFSTQPPPVEHVAKKPKKAKKR